MASQQEIPEAEWFSSGLADTLIRRHAITRNSVETCSKSSIEKSLSALVTERRDLEQRRDSTQPTRSWAKPSCRRSISEGCSASFFTSTVPPDTSSTTTRRRFSEAALGSRLLPIPSNEDGPLLAYKDVTTGMEAFFPIQPHVVSDTGGNANTSPPTLPAEDPSADVDERGEWKTSFPRSRSSGGTTSSTVLDDQTSNANYTDPLDFTGSPANT